MERHNASLTGDHHLTVTQSPNTSQSSQARILEPYLLSQSSQSIDNFLTPSLGSVQSGLLETSSLLSSAPLDQTDLNTLTEYRAVNHSNRSSLVLSEDDMKSVASLGGSDVESMMVEMGKLDASQGGLETVLANRDAVIQKLSASLNKLLLERKEDGEVSRKLEVLFLRNYLIINKKLILGRSAWVEGSGSLGHQESCS